VSGTTAGSDPFIPYEGGIYVTYLRSTTAAAAMAAAGFIAMSALPAEAGVARFVVATREVNSSTKAPASGGPDGSIINNIDNDKSSQAGGGSASLTAFSSSDPTPGTPGDEVTARINHRSNIADDRIDITGDFSFHLGPNATNPSEFGPIGNVNSLTGTAYEVTGGPVKLSIDMSTNAIGEPGLFQFQLYQRSTTLLDITGDQKVERILTPGQYNLSFTFVEGTSEPGTDRDGTFEFHAAFADAEGGGHAVPLPPAAAAGLLTMGGAGAARLIRRVRRGRTMNR
jgi:hypothetical protein